MPSALSDPAPDSHLTLMRPSACVTLLLGFGSVAAAGALAWTSIADEALAATARPSARGLAETSIQVTSAVKSRWGDEHVD